MTIITESGQFEWIFNATVEELEKTLVDLREEHDRKLTFHAHFLSEKNFLFALNYLNEASDLLFLMDKISKELVDRIWEEDI